MHDYEIWYALAFNRFHDNQTTKYSLRQFLINSLLHFHNFLSIPHIEMKLVTHVRHIVSMTTKQKIASGNFLIIYFFTPITCFNCVLHRLHDNQANLPHHFHNLLSIRCMEMKLIVHVYHIVSMTTKRQQIASGNFIKIEPQASEFISKERHKNERRQVNEKSCEF